LSKAVTWQEVIKAEKVYIGAVQQNSPDYPDCRAEYYDAFNRLVEVGTKPTTNIKVLLLPPSQSHMALIRKKRDMAHAGRCQSCTLRLKAFADAGVEDKIPYI